MSSEAFADLQPLNDTSTASVPESSLEPATVCSVGSTEECLSTVVATATITTTCTTPGAAVPTPALSDARIVRFNNRDLEKIQDELNALKAGGALARSTATPIVIKAELTSPQKVVTQSGSMTQTPAAARQQVVVVQKPPPTNNVLASPKKMADVRVIHPPVVAAGLARKIIAPTTCTTATGGQVITKVIINPSGAGQFMNTAAGTAVQLVNAGVSGQPALVLSSPTRPAGTAVRAGQQVVRVTGPAGLSPTKSMYVVSPVKTGGKVTMIPVSVAKSPQRIAPAPATSVAALAGSHRVVLVTAAVATSTATGSTTTKAPSGTLLQVPKMNVLLRPATTQVLAAVTQSQGATSVSTGTTATGAVQVPGTKFHYVRLVSAPTAAASQSTSSATGGKVSTLVPMTTARALAPAVSSSSVTATAVTSPVAGTTPMRVAVPIAPASSTQQQVLGTTTTTTAATQRVLIPASSVTSMSQGRSATSLSALTPGTVLSTGGAGMQSAFVVVPAQYVAQFQGGAQTISGSNATSNVAARVVLQPTSSLLGASTGSGTTTGTGGTSSFVPIAAAVPLSSASTSVGNSSSQLLLDQHQHSEATQQQASHHQSQHRGQQVNGMSSEDNSRPRKPCNCTKSQCLKLYCDCFANGEFCNSCNCNNCFNNLEHEEERQKAITACLDRNPNAFRPKIGKGKEGDHERRHTKGCNCKKSGCLKNYCECYEAKILCTNICKCVGCKNFEDSSERKTLMQLADAAEVRVQQQAAARTKISAHDLPMRPPAISDTGERLPFTFITNEVVEATCQCLLARSENGCKVALNAADIERSVLEEFGRCLLAIIDSANKTKGTRCSD